MKLFLAKFGDGSSTPECAVVWANNVREVKHMVLESVSEYAIFVDKEPEAWTEECQITEKALAKKEVIYTGFYCC